MKTKLLSVIPSFIFLAFSCGSQNTGKADRIVGGNCEDCQLMFEGMPSTLPWETKLADPGELGTPMVITGTIFKPDGKSPAPDVILYIYHTDAKGKYSPGPNQKNGRLHGHLRGWIKTDSQGRYKISSIRPASYPNGQAPQHIHPIIKEFGSSPYWIDEYLFDDDPFLNQEEKNRQAKRGGPGIIQLTKNEKGVWVGKRDIILGMNIPGY